MVGLNKMSQTCIYYKSGIGNFIQATPAMRALASMDESEKVDICFDADWLDDPRIPAIIDIIKHSPFINRLVRYPGDIRLGDYKTWFTAVNCEISNASKDISRKFPQDIIWASVDWNKTCIHEMDINMLNAYRLGYKGSFPPLFAPIAKNPILNFDRPLIGLCNGAFEAPMWEKKRWPYFKDLALVLKDYFDGTIIGIGGTGELDGVVMDENYCGKTSITESTKIISQLDLFITTDTGCMHIADALKIPSIVLFGPTLVSKNGPRNKELKIIRSVTPCSPCQYKEPFYTCSGAFCMETITIDKVMAEVRGILDHG
jgi:ADP-heptose:LPS heptosyltransferase